MNDFKATREHLRHEVRLSIFDRQSVCWGREFYFQFIFNCIINLSMNEEYNMINSLEGTNEESYRLIGKSFN